MAGRGFCVAVAALAAACSVTSGTNDDKGSNGTKSTTADVGAPCRGDGDCAPDGSRVCLQDAPAASGVCIVPDCKTDSCPEGSACMLRSGGERACLKACAEDADCSDGHACDASGVCVVKCSSTSCGEAGSCDVQTGKCAFDVTKAPSAAFPAPACDDLPPRDCTEGPAECGKVVPAPRRSRGFDNYPLNGETEDDQYRSFARRDLVMLLQWAGAYVECKARHWPFGNKQPLAPGDMSEASGAIPGTRENEPGHPKGTHTNGFDADVGYFQLKPPDNQLRPICPHTEVGRDAYHCTSEPNNLDVWRTALVLGALFSSDRVRVIGVDGKVGPLVIKAAAVLCRDGWLPQKACDAMKRGLAFEETDQGRGWYQFHHHHFHVSLKNLAWAPSGAPQGAGVGAPTPAEPVGGQGLTLLPSGERSAHEALEALRGPGHAFTR